MHTKNNVLIFYDYFSPAYKAGGPIQSLHSMVKALNNNNVEFAVFCSDHDLDGSKLEVQKDAWVKYENASVFYASQQSLSIGHIVKCIQEKKATVLFINGIYSWYFNTVPILFARGVRKIVSVRGMLHPGALSQKPLKKKVYLLLWKLLGLHRACEFHATTVDEKHFIEGIFGKTTKVWVAGNFPKVLNYHSTPLKKAGSLILISVALISAMKNHLLVLQALQKSTENITYLIYGPVKEDSYWKECLLLIKQMPANVSVIYKGEMLPAKIPEALQEAHVFILPSKSENFGHAIFEAMTAGKPLITSHFTPWNNLEENEAGLNVSIDNCNEIREAIHFFAIADNTTLQKWSLAARKFAIEAVDTNDLTRQHMEMFSGNTFQNL